VELSARALSKGLTSNRSNEQPGKGGIPARLNSVYRAPVQEEREVKNNEKILVETFRNKYSAAHYVNQVREFMIDSQERVFDIQEYEFVLPGSE